MDRSLEPIVSVVTPFYNTERYLAECIEGVLSQTYKNYEYILVNNCSTDQSLEIAQKYAQRDSRIRLFSNDKFLTQVQNYNHALIKISNKSKYCKIVQADDWIFSDCIRQMVAVAETNPNISIVSSYRLLGPKVANAGLPYPSTCASGREVCRLQLLTNLFFFGSPTSILFRSDIIKSRVPFYSENSLHEDTEVCYEILENSNFGFVHQILTFTRTENESITSTTCNFNPDILDKFIIVKKYGPKYLNKKEYQECFRNIKRRYFLFLGERALYKQKKGFWEYHKQGLDTIGFSLRRELWKYALLALLYLLLNPKQSAERLIERYKRKS